MVLSEQFHEKKNNQFAARDFSQNDRCLSWVLFKLPKNLHGSAKIAQKSTKNLLTWRVYDAHTGNRNVNQARELDVSKNKKKKSIRLFSTNSIW